MKFYIDYCDYNDGGIPIYQEYEQSFDFEPWTYSDFSLMLGSSYMSLDVNLSNCKIQHLSGLSPIKTWEKNKVDIPVAKKGTLFIEKDQSFTPGIGIEYDCNTITTYDKNSGWIRIGEDYKSNTCQYVMFANNTIVALDDDKIVTVWIKPIFCK